MSVTVVLDEPLRNRNRRIECESARLLGTVLQASPVDAEEQLVVPLENVLGVEGSAVDQSVEELPSPGGQYTELVTDIS